MQHEQLWAPWRLNYIQSEPVAKPNLDHLSWLAGADRECFLCRAAIDPDRRATLTVVQREHAMVVLNRFPYNNGHLLIAPRRHVGELSELTVAEQTSIHQLMIEMTAKMRDKMRCEGVNIGLNLGRVAGAGVPGHLHWHVVPRWSGDTNFMPVMANVRVIPQALEALFDLLVEE
jgi:ATP adenylyltransferase